MKKSFKIPLLMAIVTCVISISGSYAATNYAISATKIGYSDNSNLGVDNVQAAIDGTCTNFSNQLMKLESSIITKIYPVGSIYFSETDSTIEDVQERFGGTWIAYGSGKTLIGAGTGTDSTGKSQTFSVSSNSENLGTYSHSHMTPLFKANIGSSIDDNAVYTNWNGSNWGFGTLTTIWSGAYAKFTISGAAGERSGYPLLTSSTSTLGPYITVYMYKRTA